MDNPASTLTRAARRPWHFRLRRWADGTAFIPWSITVVLAGGRSVWTLASMPARMVNTHVSNHSVNSAIVRRAAMAFNSKRWVGALIRAWSTSIRVIVPAASGVHLRLKMTLVAMAERAVPNGTIYSASPSGLPRKPVIRYCVHTRATCGDYSRRIRW